MRLRRKGWKSKSNAPCQIAEAIETHVLTWDADTDSIMRAQWDAEGSVRFAGKLVQLLHDKGVLGDGDVLKLLDGYWVKEDEDVGKV